MTRRGYYIILLVGVTHSIKLILLIKRKLLQDCILGQVDLGDHFLQRRVRDGDIDDTAGIGEVEMTFSTEVFWVSKRSFTP